QLARMKMKGYNEALSGGPEEVLEWAEENGFLISGGAESEPELYAKYNSAWASFLENEDSVSHWTINLYKGFSEGNEKKWPNRVRDFREAKDGGFSDWAREKHGTLEKLNDRWGSDYESWDEISLPDLHTDELVELYDGMLDLEKSEDWQMGMRIGWRGERYTWSTGKYPELLDFMRYMRKVWAKNYDERIEKMREYLGDDYLYSTKSKPDPYWHRASEQFNQASFDYGPGKQHPHTTQEFVDGVQIPLGWPVWDSEDHKYNHGRSTPRRVRVDIFSEYLMGQFQSTGYDWVKNNRTRHRRGARHRYKTAMVTRRQIRKNEDVFRAFYEARKEADLAVFMNEGNRAFDVYDPMNEPYEVGATVKAFGHMDALGRPWKYVMDLDISADAVTDTLVLDAPWLTDESAEKLAELPEDRRIIAIGEVPSINEYGKSLPEEALEKLQDRATVIENWDALTDEVSPAEGLMDPYTRVTTAGFHTWNRFRGQPRWTNQKPVARLALRRVEHDGDLYLAVVNWKDEAITAPIPWAEEGEVRNLVCPEDPDAVIEDTDAYEYPKEGVALFKISK
ncbi:MAG: beta-galactosidase, partial [Planctomycetota bacterium]